MASTTATTDAFAQTSVPSPITSSFPPSPSARHSVLLRGGADTALTLIDSFWKSQNPLVTAAIVAGTKATLADAVAQGRQGGDEPFDKRRTLSFLIYGSLYQGCVQELVYNNLYNALFGAATTARVVTQKVLFDAIFHNALVCIPMAYMVKAIVYRYSIVKGLQLYLHDVRKEGLLLKYYALWMPVNALLFSVVPPHWRIVVMATVSFFWMMILSTISARSQKLQLAKA